MVSAARHLAGPLRVRPGELILVVDDAGGSTGSGSTPWRVPGDRVDRLVPARLGRAPPAPRRHPGADPRDRRGGGGPDRGRCRRDPPGARSAASAGRTPSGRRPGVRWGAIAREAAELAHRADIPAVHPLTTLGAPGRASGGHAYPRLHGGRAAPLARWRSTPPGPRRWSSVPREAWPVRSPTSSATPAPRRCTWAPGCCPRGAPPASPPRSSSARRGPRHRPPRGAVTTTTPAAAAPVAPDQHRRPAAGGRHRPRLQGQLRGDGRPRRAAGGPRLRGRARRRARRRPHPQLVRRDAPGRRHHAAAAAPAAASRPRLSAHPHRLLGGRQPGPLPRAGADGRPGAPGLDAVFRNAEKSRIADHVAALAARRDRPPRPPPRGCAAAPSSRCRTAATTAARTAWCGGPREPRRAFPAMSWCPAPGPRRRRATPSSS